MKTRSMFSKTLAALLALVMLIGLIPVTAMAAGTDGESESGTSGVVATSTDDHLHLNKTAVLQADGTWTVTLEAYATGVVTRTYEEKVTPTDIILVLDQSGSMDNSQYYINYSGYSVVSTDALPTNGAMATGSTVYYYYDSRDQKYYPITAAEQIVTHDSYWVYSEDFGQITAGTKVCLESEAAGKIGTTLTYGSVTQNFDAGQGYLLGNYYLYQRIQSGSGSSRRYNYRLVHQNGTDVENGQYALEQGERYSNTAYQKLVSQFPYYQVDQITTGYGGSRTYYALLYVPVELENNNVSYYTYSYVDDKNQTWVIGHSETGTGLADDKFPSSLGSIYVTSSGSGPRLTALKSAATSFIHKMQIAAASHQVDHHIAVVGFASTDSDGTNYGSYHYSNAEVFVGSTQYNYASDGTQSTYNGTNASEYYSNGVLKAEDLTTDTIDSVYGQALQNVNTTTGYSNLLASISSLGASGGTFPSHGFEMATEIAKLHEAEYKKGTRDLVVVFMTDGVPGWDGFDDDEAAATVTAAETLRNTYKARIHTVALLSSAPTEDSDTTIDDEDDFLDAVTYGVADSGESHYTLAANGVDLTNFFNSIQIKVDTTVSSVQLSENAFMVDRVSEYFNMPSLLKQGAEESDDAYKARVAAWLEANVAIYTADHTGSHEFAAPVEQDVTYDLSMSDPENDGKIHVWPTFSDGDDIAHGITVHNFDYLSHENMVTTETLGYVDADGDDAYTAPEAGEYTDTNENGYYDLGDTVVDGQDYLIKLEDAANQTDPHYTTLISGKKIIVVIEGITAKDAAAMEAYVPTNNASSGLWDIGTSGTYGMLEAFPMPYADITSKVYILDYAKEARLAALVHSMDALALDNAADAVMSAQAYTSSGDRKVYASDSLTTESGVLKFGDVKIGDYKDTYGDHRHLYYTPKTMQWDGYDTFYVLWQAKNEYDSNHNLTWSDGDPVTGYGWTKVSVLPANNVYYEDTFITTSTDDTAATGRVGIEFGEGWSFTEVEDGKPVEGDNIELPENTEGSGANDTHGWVESLADDTGHTDGTVAVGDGTNNSATATFTFTGTGMDIYSYTDENCGTIFVQVEPVNPSDKYEISTKYFIMDNYSASGNYYQIPTISYMARGKQVKDDDGNVLTTPVEDVLVHGTYRVTLTVTNAAKTRFNYYLDGIRVYNPLGSEQENNPTVSEGYGGEVHSFFYNIRDYLISANDFVANSENAGTVFIDQIKEGQVEGEQAGVGVDTTVIGTYEDYGPKNEVYLAKNQMIVMKVDIVDGRHYYVSLKSPTGEGTTAEISHSDSTKATVNVNHSADLYYEVVPTAGGYIAVKNTGDALLSVTKFQITGLDPNPHDDVNVGGDDEGGNTDSGIDTASILPVSEEEAVTYARTFARMASAPYTGAGTSGATESDTTEDAPAEPEQPEVDITNPEQPETPSVDEIKAKFEALVERLFNSVRNWFNT